MAAMLVPVRFLSIFSSSHCVVVGVHIVVLMLALVCFHVLRFNISLLGLLSCVMFFVRIAVCVLSRCMSMCLGYVCFEPF